MLRKRWLLPTTLFFLVAVASLTDAADSVPRVFVLNGQALVANRQMLRENEPRLTSALQRLIHDADRKLTVGPFAVTDKSHKPPSGDKHDYQSVGPYWWPDPSKPDGKPYLRKDGQVNPERHALGDASRFKEMQDAVTTLAAAWFFTQEDRYAAHAVKLLRTWFLDPATRMNPNMNYAQAIPGRTEGRGIGIVDAAGLPMLIDAVGMLESSSVWTPQDQAGLILWFETFLEWLRTSKNGREEDRTKNNHATQYDAQVASYALFVAKPEIARQVLESVGPRRVATQIRSDGAQPAELARTKSWDYSCGNTKNFTRLAMLGGNVDVDLWTYENNGRSIPRAIDFLLPFALGEKKWPNQQIGKFDRARLLTALLQAAPHDKTGRYAAAARALLPEDTVEKLFYSPL